MSVNAYCSLGDLSMPNNIFASRIHPCPTFFFNLRRADYIRGLLKKQPFQGNQVVSQSSGAEGNGQFEAVF